MYSFLSIWHFIYLARWPRFPLQMHFFFLIPFLISRTGTMEKGSQGMQGTRKGQKLWSENYSTHNGFQQVGLMQGYESVKGTIQKGKKHILNLNIQKRDKKKKSKISPQKCNMSPFEYIPANTMLSQPLQFTCQYKMGLIKNPISAIFQKLAYYTVQVY